jgi:hypothetical protein
MKDIVDVHARHYTNIVERFYIFQRQRNLSYFIFVGVSCLAAVLTYGDKGTHSILARIISLHSRIPEQEITTALPFRAMYSFIGFCVLLSLTLLSHRAEVAQSTLSYLGRLENHIRSLGAIPEDSNAYTFFRARSSAQLSIIGRIFTLLLVLPIAYIFSSGIYIHFPSQFPFMPLGPLQWANQNFEFIVDVTVAVFVISLLTGYLTRRWRYRTA